MTGEDCDSSFRAIACLNWYVAIMREHKQSESAGCADIHNPLGFHRNISVLTVAIQFLRVSSGHHLALRCFV